MRRWVALPLALLLAAGIALAAPQADKMKGPLLCKLTNKKIEKCCCEQREGKLYCTLEKKTIEKCCCEPAKGEKRKAAKKY